MAPFEIARIAGTVGYALVFGAIGFAFGAVLEVAGFGDTRKLAAQFYLREMTVLKVMFTAIAVAAVLIFLASALGLLDLNRVWVNPTYLWPGIVGGLVMGVGFVVGGFCPGTSLVAAATLKVDGIFFVLGGLFGVYAFGESVASYESFWLSSYMGRFTLPEWFGLPPGVTVLFVVLMALAAFWGAEAIERRFGSANAPAPTAAPLGRRGRRIAAGALLAMAAVLALRGQPSAEERWARSSPALHRMFGERAMLADPAEIVALRKDTAIRVEVLDLRGEHDFNLFHVGGARRVDVADLDRPEELKRLHDRPASSVTFLAGNGEAEAISAWKRLETQGVTNLYVVEGGMNRWLDLYPVPACVATRLPAARGGELAHGFQYATGESLPSSSPELSTSRGFRFPCSPAASGGLSEGQFPWPNHPFTKRVKLQLRTLVKGGCG
jgi:rhodanese-related sulfurtransferase